VGSPSHLNLIKLLKQFKQLSIMAKINKAQILTVIPYTNHDLTVESLIIGKGDDAYELKIPKGLVTQGGNTQFCTLRVQQKTFATSPKGVLVKVERTSRMTVAVDFMEDVKAGTNINEILWSYGLPMKRIVVEESFEPFYVGQVPKLYPASHPEHPLEEIMVDGQNIYYQTMCVDWADEAQDTRIVSGTTVEEPMEDTEQAVTKTAAELKAEAIAEAKAQVAAAKTAPEKAVAQAALKAANAMVA
jgi:hypothetical protein